MPPRRRAQLSREAIVEQAIAILDSDGAPGLTLRGLAAQLGGGLGSLYWHVRSKDELLELATDAVMAQVLADLDAIRTGTLSPDALDSGDGVPGPPSRSKAVEAALADLRLLALALFRQLQLHPWAAAYLQIISPSQPHALRVWEVAGQRVGALGVSPTQQLHGVSALISYVVGVGSEMAAQTPTAPEGEDAPADRHEALAQMVEEWRALDPAEYPFVTATVDEFVAHEDVDQFVGGLDLLILGLRVQATRR